MIWRFARWLALFLALAGPARAQEACRLGLVLALDVSGSVDMDEYRLQLWGLERALADPDVEAALFAGAPVAVAVFEWSSSRYQRVIQDWVLLEDPGVLMQLRQKLLAWTRAPAPEATGIGAALRFAGATVARAPKCGRYTVDISGDGKNNDWPRPDRLRRDGALLGLTINGLVVAPDALGNGSQMTLEIGELSAYFRAVVIQGPDAFVETALGYSDYARAMRKKLLRELALQGLSHNDWPPDPTGRIVALED